MASVNGQSSFSRCWSPPPALRWPWLRQLNGKWTTYPLRLLACRGGHSEQLQRRTRPEMRGRRECKGFAEGEVQKFRWASEAPAEQCLHATLRFSFCLRSLVSHHSHLSFSPSADTHLSRLGCDDSDGDGRCRRATEQLRRQGQVTMRERCRCR